LLLSVVILHFQPLSYKHILDDSVGSRNQKRIVRACSLVPILAPLLLTYPLQRLECQPARTISSSASGLLVNTRASFETSTAL
jgi:hypothetical protein